MPRFVQEIATVKEFAGINMNFSFTDQKSRQKARAVDRCKMNLYLNKLQESEAFLKCPTGIRIGKEVIMGSFCRIKILKTKKLTKENGTVFGHKCFSISEHPSRRFLKPFQTKNCETLSHDYPLKNEKFCSDCYYDPASA